jgi:cobalt-precorrin-6B (C15)-methyltransferase
MNLKGGPTQDEILAISLWKLGIQNGDVVADIGCGTGKVAVAASARAGRIIAIDKRPEAIAVARDAVVEAGADNIELRLGEATDILASIGHLDSAFVGGSQHLEDVLELLIERVTGAIVINAVLFEECILAQIARSRSLADGMMLEPINPVYIIVGRGRGC